MINAHTQLVGLLGWPVAHSLSPAMHNAAFDALGLNWRYVPLPVHPSRVEEAVRGLAALGFRGANVTVPHKQAVIPALDSLDVTAQVLGAVNTLLVERQADGSTAIRGYNTDAPGFAGALRVGGFEPGGGQDCLVVGAGGAARAVVLGLLQSGLAKIVVLNRTLERAQALVAHLGWANLAYPPRLSVLPLTQDALVESARAAGLLVNATQVGMWPHVDASIWPEAVPLPAHLSVYDLVYNPLETRLLRQARAAGANAIDGLGMLVGQGAVAFEMWTGQGPAERVAALMRAACERALATLNLKS
ncbi:MAG: shikimate dehydrogenase [Thermoflexales bacterium]|nr:shikimate dehydrogenase [Thermoflexales bacterium]